MKIWRLMTHHENPEQALEWSRREGRIAIGWGYVGDIRAEGYHSAKDIAAHITHLIAMGVHPYNNAGQGGACLWNFYATMRPGDLVIVNTNRPRLVVEVTGDYEWKPDEPGLQFYQHQRTAKVTTLVPEALWRSTYPAPGVRQSIRWTLIERAKLSK